MDAESEWARLTREERERDLIHNAGLFTARLHGDGPLTSDWHLPLTSYTLIDAMIRDAEKLGMGKWLVIAGDLFHQDAMSDHWPKQETAGFEHEMKVANRVMLRLLRHFDVVVVTRGNHDEKVEKRLQYAVRFERTVRMILHELTEAQQKRLVVSETDAVMIDTDEGPWRACHSRSYSRVQLSVPARLADRHRCNIASGHRHHTALGFSPSGYRVAELGGMFDEARTEYLQRWTTDFPKWQPSYMLLRNGRILCPALSGPVA